MIYVMQAKKDKDLALIFDKPQPASGDYDFPSFAKGTPVGDSQPLQVILYTSPRDKGEMPKHLGTRLTDTVNNVFTGLIVSTRFRKVLESIGVANIEYIPLKVKNPKTKEEFDYWIANILGTIACLDRDKADVDWDEDDGSVFMMNQLAIDEAAVKASNKKAKKPLDLFRLEERPRYLLATEKIKKAVDEAGLTGVDFKDPSDCGDFL